VTRIAPAAIAALILAAGCGSDLGPGPATRAAPVRIDVLGGGAPLAAGVTAAVRFVGAVRVAEPAQADLVVSSDAAGALRAARAYPRAHVLLIGAAPAGPLPANLRVEQVSRGAPAYLAGAVAALAGKRHLAVVPSDAAVAAAAVAGADAVGASDLGVVTAGADAAYITASGAPAPRGVAVITATGPPPPNALAVVGPRLAVVVAAAARLVQDGQFRPGVYTVGLGEDAVGIVWLSPSVGPAAAERLQRLEDAIRAGTAAIPAVAPAPAQE
jgi:basic membrane lipoprotein Med (substrate-binding protein (PBP1-ABC) superfamily)